MEDFAPFARLIGAVRPWLRELVVVGGWAHRLYRFHPLARPPGYLALRTRDADLAFSLDAALRGDVGAALREAGFCEDLLGEHVPPVTHYRLGKENAGFFAEFLVPLQGGGVKRDGRADATLSRAGITAQKLRHLELLLVSPWVVRVGPALGVPVGEAADLLVPNPVSFVAQKLLIHSARGADKKAQDVLYLHDTLELFGASLDALHALWANDLRPVMAARTASKVRRIAGELFEEVTDTVRDAARIPLDRSLQPEHVRAACHIGLEAVFGPWA